MSLANNIGVDLMTSIPLSRCIFDKYSARYALIRLIIVQVTEHVIHMAAT